jgi:hypothetical protein
MAREGTPSRRPTIYNMDMRLRVRLHRPDPAAVLIMQAAVGHIYKKSHDWIGSHIESALPLLRLEKYLTRNVLFMFGIIYYAHRAALKKNNSVAFTTKPQGDRYAA